jgi:hypothetical protein
MHILRMFHTKEQSRRRVQRYICHAEEEASNASQCNYYYPTKAFVFYVTSCCTNIELWLCHSLVRLVRCAAFMIAKWFYSRVTSLRGTNRSTYQSHLKKPQEIIRFLGLIIWYVVTLFSSQPLECRPLQNPNCLIF